MQDGPRTVAPQPQQLKPFEALLCVPVARGLPVGADL